MMSAQKMEEGKGEGMFSDDREVHLWKPYMSDLGYHGTLSSPK